MSLDWSYEFGAVKTPDGLTIKGRAYFDRVISTLGDGESVTVTLAKPVDKRSLQQNRSLWGPVYDSFIAGLVEKLAHEEGIESGDKPSKELLHDGLLQKFSGTVIDPVTKCEVTKERSSKMSVQRFGEFLEFVARFAAEEYGIVVSLPGEQ